MFPSEVAAQTKDEKEEAVAVAASADLVLDYDALLAEVGEFGFFQKLACFLLWLPGDKYRKNFKVFQFVSPQLPLVVSTC